MNSVVPSLDEKNKRAVDSDQPLPSSSPDLVPQKKLINYLNFINFQNDSLLLYFRHAEYDLSIALPAKPKPCLNNRLQCVWEDSSQIFLKSKSFQFQYFLLVDKQKAIQVKPEVISVNEHCISFNLPETGQVISARQVERQSCKNIDVQFIQSSIVFSGSLIDFSAISFRIHLTATPPQKLQWINSNLPINIILTKDGEILYAGECRIIRKDLDKTSGIFIMEPNHQKISRLKAKTYRSSRHQISPTPHILFKHPFTGRMISLNIFDLSGSGFSVIEAEDKSTLLTGMIIPEVELQYANSLIAKSRMQVIYREKVSAENNPTEVKCGMVFLDMDIQDHLRLVGLLHQVKDNNAHICHTVDLDDLWSFFFETGFIYPEKYAFLQQKKEEIKETYKKLYSKHTSIARHFTYQDNGRILGHMAMIRFHTNTWLIHHHAANDKTSKKAGLIVLDQLAQFSNDAHSLHTLHMDYLLGYFRPGNKFPSRVFGGAVRAINNPQACSLDRFAYLHCRQKNLSKKVLATTWELSETRSEDLVELESFYMANSGGLMIHAMDLAVNAMSMVELTREYKQLGFIREKHLFSLNKNGVLKAIFLANLSNVGLNLSDLTNCITVFILEPESLPLDLLYSTLNQLLVQLNQESMSVLLFPSTYAENHLLPYEKLYDLWILNEQNGDEYFKYINRLLRFIRN